MELLPTKSSNPLPIVIGVAELSRPPPLIPLESSKRRIPVGLMVTADKAVALPPELPLNTTVPRLAVRFPVNVFVPVRASVPEPL